MQNAAILVAIVLIFGISILIDRQFQKYEDPELEAEESTDPDE